MNTCSSAVREDRVANRCHRNEDQARAQQSEQRQMGLLCHGGGGMDEAKQPARPQRCMPERDVLNFAISVRDRRTIADPRQSAEVRMRIYDVPALAAFDQKV